MSSANTCSTVVSEFHVSVGQREGDEVPIAVVSSSIVQQHTISQTAGLRNNNIVQFEAGLLLEKVVKGTKFYTVV